MAFLITYIRFEDPETNRTFEERVEPFTDKEIFMDIFEQVAEWQKQDLLEEGMQKVQEKSVRNLLLNTEFSVEKIASLIEVSLDFVEKIKAEYSAK